MEEDESINPFLTGCTTNRSSSFHASNKRHWLLACPVEYSAVGRRPAALCPGDSNDFRRLGQCSLMEHVPRQFQSPVVRLKFQKSRFWNGRLIYGVCVGQTCNLSFLHAERIVFHCPGMVYFLSAAGVETHVQPKTPALYVNQGRTASLAFRDLGAHKRIAQALVCVNSCSMLLQRLQSAWLCPKNFRGRGVGETRLLYREDRKRAWRRMSKPWPSSRRGQQIS